MCEARERGKQCKKMILGCPEWAQVMSRVANSSVSELCVRCHAALAEVHISAKKVLGRDIRCTCSIDLSNDLQVLSQMQVSIRAADKGLMQ